MTGYGLAQEHKPLKVSLVVRLHLHIISTAACNWAGSEVAQSHEKALMLSTIGFM